MKLNINKLQQNLYINYKFNIDSFKSGGTIYIKPENKGKFTTINLSDR